LLAGVRGCNPRRWSASGEQTRVISGERLSRHPPRRKAHFSERKVTIRPGTRPPESSLFGAKSDDPPRRRPAPGGRREPGFRAFPSRKRPTRCLGGPRTASRGASATSIGSACPVAPGGPPRLISGHSGAILQHTVFADVLALVRRGSAEAGAGRSPRRVRASPVRRSAAPPPTGPRVRRRTRLGRN
jgi:hypothetical protein